MMLGYRQRFVEVRPLKQCWPGIEDLLHEALELPPDRRSGYLAQVCGGDADLKRELESLIRADEEARNFLARPFVINAVQPPDTAVERSPQRRGQLLSRLLRRAGEAPAGGRRPDDPGRLAPGSKVAERYRVLRFVGRGGMGEIYHALDLKLDESVALKFLPERMARDERTRSRFLREVKMARRVSHPNVCRVYDVREAEGHLFLSMELIDGEDLASLLKRVGRPGQAEASEILRQLCRGLEAVHAEEILHRDLKPANVMVDVHGRVRITDFGIAGVAGSVPEEALLGTPSYMAPEQ